VLTGAHLARSIANRSRRHHGRVSATNGRANLIAAHPGNVSAVKSGVYSARVLAPRAAEIALTSPKLIEPDHREREATTS
jgi:hypothetical protein